MTCCSLPITILKAEKVKPTGIPSTNRLETELKIYYQFFKSQYYFHEIALLLYTPNVKYLKRNLGASSGFQTWGQVREGVEKKKQW